MVSLGVQSLIYKIKKTEGYDAVLDFLNDMLEYQEKEPKPNQSDVYMNVIRFRIVLETL